MKSQKEKIVLFVACAVAFALPLFAQTQIYRSMQAGNTTAIKVGTGINLTISGSTATFASAMPDSIGVGDAIQYDATGLGVITNVCFIHGRTSSTVYTVKTAAGGTPTATSADDQDWSIFRAYTSLSNWESGTENTGISALVRNFDGGNRNIVTNNEYWNIACYRSTDATQLGIAGWTTDATRRMRIYTPYATSEVGTTQRHLGVNSGVRFIYNNFISIDEGAPVNLNLDYEGIVFTVSATACQSVQYQQGTADALGNIKDCVFVGRDGSGCGARTQGIVLSTNYSGTVKISNCIFYNFDGSGANTGAGRHEALLVDAGTAYVYNCTDYGSNYSYVRAGGTYVVKNSVSYLSDSDGFGGIFDAASDYNLSDRAADAPGANSKNSATVSFLNTGSLNFHLNSGDTGAGNSGTDLSADANLPVTTDIDRGARPTGANTVDMGADEGVLTATEMNVKGNNTSIADGDATPSASDSTDFGSVLVTGGTRKVTYKIFNIGETTLNISGTPKVAVAGTHSADFTVTTQPAATVAAGDSSSFVVEFDPSATGTRSATLSIANDDSDENPYNYSIQGSGITREIAVSGNSQDITNGDATPSPADGTDFGRIALVNATQTVVFTISNSGTSNLTLSGTPKVAVSGAHSSDFTVTAQPSSPIAGSGSTTFAVVFNPSGVGLRTAALSIANDDSDENPFTFSISGFGSSGRHNSFGQFHFGQHTRY